VSEIGERVIQAYEDDTLADARDRKVKKYEPIIE
jgi:hypothetical protein